jgi:uncharacterized LabA/DUF88 family protein
MFTTTTTAVYIDGYNLYYGRLRGTAFKWLDVVALSDRLLREHDPASEVALVRYFSAPCMARFASHGQASMQAQQAYHRALLQRNPRRLTLALGTHSVDQGGTLVPRYVAGSPYDRNDRVRVWKIEEKQTDVNLALAMYRDACSGRFQQQVIFSNDSDAEPVLRAVRADFSELTVGVVTPRHAPDGMRGHRNALTSLAAHAHWTRHHLRDDELEACQLPSRVPTRKKPIDRPPHW